MSFRGLKRDYSALPVQTRIVKRVRSVVTGQLASLTPLQEGGVDTPVTMQLFDSSYSCLDMNSTAFIYINLIHIHNCSDHASAFIYSVVSLLYHCTLYET